MITIFSNPRPFTGEFDLLQRNAIRSWVQLQRDCQVILINDEENTTEAVARELGVEFISVYKSNEFGTPLLDDVFEQVRKLARYDVLAQVNADILLFPDFVDVLLEQGRRSGPEGFLLLGRRWNLEVTEPLDFKQPNWRERLVARARSEGHLHGPSGMDYWVFPKQVPICPPPFCVGRPGMDSWLVFHAKSRGMPVLDATDAITIIHQQHGYPKQRAPHFEVECERNIALAGGRANMLSLREADWLITPAGDRERPPFARAMLSFLSGFATWRNLLAAKRWTQRQLAGSSR